MDFRKFYGESKLVSCSFFIIPYWPLSAVPKRVGERVNLRRKGVQKVKVYVDGHYLLSSAWNNIMESIFSGSPQNGKR